MATAINRVPCDNNRLTIAPATVILNNVFDLTTQEAIINSDQFNSLADSSHCALQLQFSESNI